MRSVEREASRRSAVMGRFWNHEIPDGTKLVGSDRTHAVSMRLKARYVRLWLALAIHHRSRLNAILAYALLELHKRGRTTDSRVLDLDVGLKHPNKIFSRTPRVSGGELKVWDELARRSGGGRPGAAVIALVELHHREPVDLMRAVLQLRRRDSGGGSELQSGF
jgi:hypothetical protein